MAEDNAYHGWWKRMRLKRSGTETQEEARQIARLLRLEQAARVLDVPCGDGRLAIEMAKLGYHVTAVDINLERLRDGSQCALSEGLEIQWKQLDMQRLPWRAEFDAAYCSWSSFGYFDDEGNLTFLRAVAFALRTGGRFYLDTPIAETCFPSFQRRSWKRLGDAYMIKECHYNCKEARLVRTWTIIGCEGIPHTRSNSLRIYTLREFLALIELAGFSGCDWFGSLREGPFCLGSEKLFAVARK